MSFERRKKEESLLLLPAALKASLAKAIEDTKSKMGTKKAEMKKVSFDLEMCDHNIF